MLHADGLFLSAGNSHWRTISIKPGHLDDLDDQILVWMKWNLSFMDEVDFMQQQNGSNIFFPKCKPFQKNIWMQHNTEWSILMWCSFSWFCLGEHGFPCTAQCFIGVDRWFYTWTMWGGDGTSTCTGVGESCCCCWWWWWWWWCCCCCCCCCWCCCCCCCCWWFSVANWHKEDLGEHLWKGPFDLKFVYQFILPRGYGNMKALLCLQELGHLGQSQE